VHPRFRLWINSVFEKYCRWSSKNLQFIYGVARGTKSICPRVMELHRKTNQHVKLCAWGFAYGFILFCERYCRWLSKKFQCSTCVTHSSKCIWHSVLKLNRNIDQYVKLCTWGFVCEFIFSYCPWLSENLQFLICVVHSSKCIDL
jgi:hypothetical protein